jgi:hypothetical protein
MVGLGFAARRARVDASLSPLDRLFAKKLLFWGDVEAARIYAALRKDRIASAEVLSRIESHWTAAGISQATRTLIDMLCEGETPAGIDHHLRGAPTGRSRTDIGLIQHAFGSLAEVLGIARAA